MYLGGGKLLKAGEAALKRTEPGLASIEKAETGAYVAGNPSPTEATVTVTFAPLPAMEAFDLDAAGKRSGAGDGQRRRPIRSRLKMKAASKVEFAPKGAVSVYDYRQAMLRQAPGRAGGGPDQGQGRVRGPDQGPRGRGQGQARPRRTP